LLWKNAASVWHDRRWKKNFNHTSTDAAMPYSSHLAPDVSTRVAAVRRGIQEIQARLGAQLEEDCVAFVSGSISPTAVLDFEARLAARVRELGRAAVALACNQLEGDDPSGLPSHLRSEGIDYRLVKSKTRAVVDTMFGPVVLWRHLYRPADRDSSESSFAPLERSLGVVSQTTPALAEAACRYLAEAGATQQAAIDRLRCAHGVAMGVGRLRALAAHVSGAMAAAREEMQVQRLLALLGQAEASRGRHRPVLSVGRDGITLGTRYRGGCLFEVASTATVSVLDRRGKRLGTVYLAFVPESGQPRMGASLTSLLAAVLMAWTGALPRLAYVTDAGENETQYYRRVLRPMVHPRTGERLSWQRVVDFYHAMERVWALAAALFGADARGLRSWARKMGRLLKQPNGASRVLHSAAALRGRRGLSKSREAAYRKASNYLRRRTRWMQYAAYRRVGVPLGSGVTEAGCKTIYSQRLKLSGMRWKEAGAQVILDLRVALLSGIWRATYGRVLATSTNVKVPTPHLARDLPRQLAA
jgi:hypothetical protein